MTEFECAPSVSASHHPTLIDSRHDNEAHCFIRLPAHVLERAEPLPQPILSYYASLFESLPISESISAGVDPLPNIPQVTHTPPNVSQTTHTPHIISQTTHTSSTISQTTYTPLSIPQATHPPLSFNSPYGTPTYTYSTTHTAANSPYSESLVGSSASTSPGPESTLGEQHPANAKDPRIPASDSPLSTARTCSECNTPGKFDDAGKCIEKWGPGPMGRGTACDRCYHAYKRKKARERHRQEAPEGTQELRIVTYRQGMSRRQDIPRPLRRM